MFNVFKITDAGGQSTSKDLLGLLIVETNQGYFLVNPESENDHEPPRIMADAIFNIKRPPVAEFTFEFKKFHWQLIVEGVSTSKMHGKWKNNHKEKDTPQEEDHWVATGTGTGEPEDDEARAASATN